MTFYTCQLVIHVVDVSMAWLIWSSIRYTLTLDHESSQTMRGIGDGDVAGLAQTHGSAPQRYMT